jgi:hypothetical protein
MPADDPTMRNLSLYAAGVLTIAAASALLDSDQQSFDSG